MTPLRQRVIDYMQIRNFSSNTPIYGKSRCLPGILADPPEGLGPANIRTYQLYLTNERNLAPSSSLIATSTAHLFFVHCDDEAAL
jgi:integrase/recombinase XerD